MNAFWQKKKIYFILIIVGIIIYSNALTNQLFWDDNDGIINMPTSKIGNIFQTISPKI